MKTKLWLILIFFIISGSSCSLHLNPHNFNSIELSVPTLHDIQPVAIRAKLNNKPERELPLAGPDVVVIDDQFAEVIVERLINTLKKQGVEIDPNAKKSIEIEIPHVSFLTTARIYCVIDYNRKLGNGEFYGFQSRYNEISEMGCNKAIDNAVIQILNDPETISYLTGD